MAESGEENRPLNCALCTRERNLCRSHIVPEFLYKPGYDSLHRTPRFDSQTGQRQLVQKGHRERLLCEDCERFLNDHYEKPFQRSWYERDLVPEIPEDAESVELSEIHYTPFKLFHLSVLWRASVASASGFDVVDLGPHEEWIRRMVLEGDPGEPEEFPVTARALLYEGELAHGVVMSPAIWPVDGMRIHTMIYGGFEWWIGVGSCSDEMRDLALWTDGTMQVEVVQWSDSIFTLDGHELYARNRDD